MILDFGVRVVMLKILSDAKLRKKMGINARTYLEDNYKAKHSYEIIMSHFQLK